MIRDMQTNEEPKTKKYYIGGNEKVCLIKAKLRPTYKGDETEKEQSSKNDYGMDLFKLRRQFKAFSFGLEAKGMSTDRKI